MEGFLCSASVPQVDRVHWNVKFQRAEICKWGRNTNKRVRSYIQNGNTPRPRKLASHAQLRHILPKALVEWRSREGLYGSVLVSSFQCNQHLLRQLVNRIGSLKPFSNLGMRRVQPAVYQSAGTTFCQPPTVTNVLEAEAQKECGKPPPYVPLHVHSDFSLLDGASQLPGLVERAKELGMPALALTDHGVMYGAVQLVKLCEAAGIKPIIGNEMYLIHGDIAEKPQGRSKQHKRYHLTVLAKNPAGYRNLVQLTTISHLQGMQGSGNFARPCINRELLQKHSEGLIVCSGCQSGEVSTALLAGSMDDARTTVEWYKKVFREDYYLEVMDHRRDENRIMNQGIFALAAATDIKVVATNDSHFTRCDDQASHRALICIKTGQALSRMRHMQYTGEEYLKSGAEMLALFQESLGPAKAWEVVANTCEVAAKVESYELFSEGKLPSFHVPDGYDENSWLEVEAWQGLCSMLEAESPEALPAEYVERLRTELAVIRGQGFSAYFLVVGDIIRFARQEGIPVGPGRGSAAGSLVAYALGIIGIDPVKYGLLFERFLNVERRSLPDIDTDFCPLYRDRIIEYVTRKYGEERVAQIVTFNRLTSKAVLRGVGKVLEVPYATADALSKMVPVVRGKAAKLQDMVGEESPCPEFRARYTGNAEERAWIDMAIRLEGRHRTFGVHAAGVVIAPETFTLKEAVPLQHGLGKQGAVVTQYAMEDIEALGLLKFDLLGLKTLTCIAHAYRMVRQAYGVDLPPMERLPTNNRAAFHLMASGDVDGLFQLEASPGMRKVVRSLRPSRLEDVFAIVALYRPGPLDAGLVDTFIRRKHGQEAVEYADPALEPILAETYGVLLYQEQIMRVARDLAGYSLGQADLLRRAMGKKKVAEMQAQKARFTEGALANGVQRRVAEDLFATMVKFAEYCFNKSHSAAYGYITYVTAFLRANYPVAYMAALLSCAIGDAQDVQRYIAACRNMGIVLLPPCVNASDSDFTVALVEEAPATGRELPGSHGEGDENGKSGKMGREEGLPGGAIRFGLAAVKGIGDVVVAQLLEARAQGGPFASVPDLCLRVQKAGGDSRKTVEALVRCGALDCLERGSGAGSTQGPATPSFESRSASSPLGEDPPSTSGRHLPPPRGLPKDHTPAGSPWTAETDGGRLDDARPTGVSAAAQTGGPNRKKLLAQLEYSWEWAKGRLKERASNQLSLFDLLGEDSAAHSGNFPPPTGDPQDLDSDSLAAQMFVSTMASSQGGGGAGEEAQSQAERLQWEKELLGFYVSEHPLRQVLAQMPLWLPLLDFRHLDEVESGSSVVAVAEVVEVQRKTTRAGKAMATLLLEDCGGRCQGVVFPAAFAHLEGTLREGGHLLVWGKLDRKDEGGEEGGEGAQAGGWEGKSGAAQIEVKCAESLESARYLCIDLTVEEAARPAVQSLIRSRLRELGHREHTFGGEGGQKNRKYQPLIPGVPVVAHIWSRLGADPGRLDAREARGDEKGGSGAQAEGRAGSRSKGDVDSAGGARVEGASEQLSQVQSEEPSPGAVVEKPLIVLLGPEHNVVDAESAALRLQQSYLRAASRPLVDTCHDEQAGLRSSTRVHVGMHPEDEGAQRLLHLGERGQAGAQISQELKARSSSSFPALRTKLFR